MDTSRFKFSRIGACCKDCTERAEGCHGYCERYITAKAEWEAEKAMVREAREKLNNFDSHHYKRVTKSKIRNDKRKVR